MDYFIICHRNLVPVITAWKDQNFFILDGFDHNNNIGDRLKYLFENFFGFDDLYIDNLMIQVKVNSNNKRSDVCKLLDFIRFLTQKDPRYKESFLKLGLLYIIVNDAKFIQTRMIMDSFCFNKDLELYQLFKEEIDTLNQLTLNSFDYTYGSSNMMRRYGVVGYNIIRSCLPQVFLDTTRGQIIRRITTRTKNQFYTINHMKSHLGQDKTINKTLQVICDSTDRMDETMKHEVIRNLHAEILRFDEDNSK